MLLMVVILMYKLVIDIYKLLNANQKKQFWLLQFLVVIMSVLELIGIASIFPFIAAISKGNVVNDNDLLNWLYHFLGANSHDDFLLLLGFGVLIILALSAMVSVFTTWRLAMFASKVGTEFADRLFSFYLSRNWLFHVSKSSSELIRNISTESIRFSDFVIQPLMQLNAKIFLVILISFSIFLYEPYVALSAVTLFSGVYFVLYKFVRVRLQLNGDKLSYYMGNRFHLMNEAFGGVKDVILLGTKDFFIEKFNYSGSLFSSARGINAGISQVPKFLIEFIAFGSIVVLILYLLKENNGDIGTVLPILSVYAFAGLKLLPAIQQVYVNVSQVKGNISAYAAIENDLESALAINDHQNSMLNREDRVLVKDAIFLKDIKFGYKENIDVLKGINIKINANQVVGIVGNSGSGKSTLLDILLGLVKPSSGSIEIDKKILNEENMREWQNSIGFVAQSIFLTEGTIAQNIAFGIPDEKINSEQISNVVKMAHLTEMIKSLPDGVQSKVGERGVQLSGGQRQRIAIARALYFGADVLVFDEATSALDGITERLIMDAVHDFHGSKTIIMVAHRLKTVEKCDVIFFLEDGVITDSGSYNELFDNNKKFRKMANHS